jgi:hypothetical protein
VLYIVNMDFYERCYSCFQTKHLVGCNKCVYKICEMCILHDMFSTLVPQLCRHEGCIYDNAGHVCYVCSLHEPLVEYNCGTCNGCHSVPITSLSRGMNELVNKSGIFEKQPEKINHKMVHYRILNIDTGAVSVGSLWTVNPRSCNASDDTMSL